MRIPSGVTDQVIYFVAVDPTDLKTRETGLTSFTVYRSRDDGTATIFTTPTTNELSAANMPGVYTLLLDEDMTIGSGNDTEEFCLHITHGSMAPVTRVFELYRPKITAGNTLGVAADGDVSGNVDGNVVGSVASVTGAVASVTGAVGSVTGAVGSVASGGITAASLATDAVDEIVNGVWDELLTGGTHDVADSAGRRVRDLQEFGVYEGGAIWIDTINGTAGTTDYESGTAFNPVNTIADANTLAASLGLSRFRVAPGSSITFAAAQANQSFEGHEWTLALGGQSIAGTEILGATISGTGTGSGYVLIACSIGVVTLADGEMRDCGLAGTFTASAAADYYFDGCFSQIAGSGSWTFDFGAAVVNTNLNLRHHSGGVTINNKDNTGTDLMSVEGHGQLVVAASSSGAISLRGGWEVTNTGGATITYDDLSQNAIDILALLSVKSGTATGGSTTTLIDTVNLTEVNADHWRGCWLLITSGALTGQTRLIIGFAPASDQLTFVPAVPQAITTETYEILPTAGVNIERWRQEAPAVIISGRINTSVGAMQTDVLNAAALATDAVDEIKDAILPVINVAKSNIPFYLALSSDGISPATGLSPSAERSIDGAAFVAASGSVTEISDGIYQFDALAADMNGTLITFRFFAATANDSFVVEQTGG